MTFSVTVLGSSSALPTSKRFTSAYVLNVHERFFLIDCGEGTQIQLRKFRFKLNRINHIFISHLHGDHILGLFGLLSSYNLLGRKSKLHIYANKGIKDILKTHFRFFGSNEEYEIVFHFLNPEKNEIIYEDRNLMVNAFPLNHRIETHGFLFSEKKRPDHIYESAIEKYKIPLKKIFDIKMGADFLTDDGEIIKNDKLTHPSYTPRSFVYCTDTLYNETIIPVINNTDLLLHEATYSENLKNRAIETFHSTAKQAGRIAALAQVKHLIISHFSSRYKNPDLLLKEAQNEFNNVYTAEDGKIFEILIDGSIKINEIG